MDSEYLVVYDYGMGGLWGVLLAPSEVAIKAKYPELRIASERPAWMTEEAFQRLREQPLWLDAEPEGMLQAVVSDREHD